MKKHLLALATILIGAISSNAQLINPGFETWSTNIAASSAMDPNSGNGTSGWWDFNMLNSSALGSSPISVFREGTIVHSGSYSAKIVTVVLTTTSYNAVKPYGIPDTMGMIITGNINVSFTGAVVKIGIPFTQRISAFQFYYQYAPNGSDTASCAVVLSHFSGGKRNTLGAGLFQTPVAASNWTQGTVNMFYDSATGNPDTILVVFNSSGRKNGKPGSTLYVDDASVVTGINELTAPATSIDVYPNPASTEVNFSITGNTQASYADIYDITGKKINTYNIRNNFAAIKTAYYAPGLYFYQVYDKTGNLMKTGKFSVTR